MKMRDRIKRLGVDAVLTIVGAAVLAAACIGFGFLVDSAQAQGTGTVSGVAVGRQPPNFSVISAPAAGSQGTASIAAGGAGVKHVADCISFSAGAATAPAAITSLLVNLRDGATGAGTILWQQRVIIPAATGQHVTVGPLCGLNFVGTANTAMTLEWSAALANEEQSVTLGYYNAN